MKFKFKTKAKINLKTNKVQIKAKPLRKTIF